MYLDLFTMITKIRFFYLVLLKFIMFIMIFLNIVIVIMCRVNNKVELHLSNVMYNFFFFNFEIETLIKVHKKGNNNSIRTITVTCSMLLTLHK